ncbi:MAG: glycosyltransferase [Aeromicrobium sp.]
MKILVYPHDLGIGGSQLNAIDIAHEVSRRGHEVLVYGQPGPLTTRVEQLGLEFIESPPLHRRPTTAVVTDLARLIDQRGIDIVHGYEWPPGLEAYLACRGKATTRAVTTVMSMAVAPFLPHDMSLVVGTRQIAAREVMRGRRRVSVIEPPVDTFANRPGVTDDVRRVRQTWGLRDDGPIVVCVTRLARQLKLEGLLTTIDAIGMLHPEHPAQLLIVGDGDARREVDERADEVNRRLGHRAVVMTGEVDDPRPAYEIADVCIAMGGSALRSLAFAKPLVVQGEGGFFRLLTPATIDEFLWTGWYGHGHGGDDPVSHLRTILRGVLSDAAQRSRLGAFGRTTVEQRFSLTAAADHQLEIYRSAFDPPLRGPRRMDEVAAAARFGAYHLDKRAAKVIGRRSTDDFNARPVARDGPPRPVPGADGAGAIVYFAGVSWDAVGGTDRHLACALARHQRILWVDPPMSWTARRRRGITVPPLSDVGERITRVNTTCPPGVSRPVLRRLARWLTERRAAGAVRRTGLAVSTIIVSSPEQLVPRWRGDIVRVYYETDDFVAGATLLGITARYARRLRTINVRRSDIVLGIASSLTDDLADGTAIAETLPNGTDHRHFQTAGDVTPPAEIHLQAPIVGVVGQLNDRLDVEMLEAVADLEVSLLLLGPRYDSPATRSRLDALIDRPNVQWIDRQPFDRLPAFLAAMDVGLTPYTSTSFNRSSSPLKSLEYLAAGLPVVSTDLPSARALDTDLLALAGTPSEFAKLTAQILERPSDPALVTRRRAFAARQGWDARAEQLRTTIARARSVGS